MILLLDLGFRANSLSRDEFVLPVGRIAERSGKCWIYRHYADMGERIPEETGGIVICGTALRDNGFLRKIDRFGWLSETEIPVLGICAGMQVLCLTHGGTVREGCEIGMTDIHVVVQHPLLPLQPSFQAYELHSFSCSLPPGFEALAVSTTCLQAMRHLRHPRFGVMFHPEVRNDRVVERFLEMCGE